MRLPEGNRIIAATALLWSIALLISGCASARPLTLEEKAQEINKSLICPVCPGETIDQSQATLAKQMRQQVVEQLNAGKSKDEIIQFFEDRYGESVLAAPPKTGFNLVAWLLPPLAVSAGLLLVVFVVTRMSRRPQTAGQSLAAPPQTLEKYLSTVDDELKKRTSGPAQEKGKE